MPRPDRSPATLDAQTRSIDRRDYLLLLAFALPLLMHAMLFAADVPLGYLGRFHYRYSPVYIQRLLAGRMAFGLAVVVGVALVHTAATTRLRRAGGTVLALVVALALAIWSFFAPPLGVREHVFNAYTPSHDGAFVIEALTVESTTDYLAQFPERARQSPEEMMGTRVVSNPPGITLLAIAADRLLAANATLREWATRPLRDQSPNPIALHAGAVGLTLFWMLTGLWLLAAVPLYLAARLFLPHVGALFVAFIGVFSPMTLLFTPGKDPAQLLTVALPLWLWLLAWRRSSTTAAVAAGFTFALACVVGLVHVWIGAIVIGATLVHVGTIDSAAMRRVLLRGLLPALIGTALTWLVLWRVCGFNMIATARAVADAQSAVTRGPNAMPLIWQSLGVPLFMLFAGAGLWTLTLWWVIPPAPDDRTDDEPSRFGRWLLTLTLGVMLATIGFTNLETPRLWIPFVPLLTLGLALQLGTLRTVSRRHAALLGVLTAAHITAAVLQWTLMDPREAEYRLIERTLFG